MDNLQDFPNLMAVFNNIEKEIGKDIFDIWLRPTTLSFSNNHLTIIAPNEFWVNNIKKKYDNIIINSFLKILGENIEIDYKVEKKENSSTKVNILPPTPRNFKSNLNSYYTFENFIESDSNRFAYKATEAAALHYKENSNVDKLIFVYSTPGLGKTHLLHAVGNKILESNPTAKVFYTTGEDFVIDFVNSLQQKNNNNSFKEYYSNLDCLLIDDIQFVAGKDKSQEEFFYILNALRNKNKVIIISSDRSPQQLGLSERTTSRLLQGLPIEIKKPDYETRLAILKLKKQSANFIIGDDVLAFIAQGIQTNVRELEGALNKLVKWCVFNNFSPTISIAKQILKDVLVDETTINLNINYIKKVISKAFNIKIEDLSSKKRTQSITWPRQISMYLATQLTDLTVIEIGREFNRDYSTIIHGRDLVEEKLNSDPFFSAQMNQWIEDIKNMDKHKKNVDKF